MGFLFFMRFYGGKTRLLKFILPVLKNHWRGLDGYIEPFVGGASVISNITFSPRFKIASDYDASLIKMWQQATSGEFDPPSSITREEYYEVKSEYEVSALRAFVKYGCSFGGKAWGGYASGKGRNFALESRNMVLDRANRMTDVMFLSGDYKDVLESIAPQDCMIFCDPPSLRHSGYKRIFNRDEFYEYMRVLSVYNKVIIYDDIEAPKDFKAVWSQVRDKNIPGSYDKKPIMERLYTWKRWKITV